SWSGGFPEQNSQVASAARLLRTRVLPRHPTLRVPVSRLPLARRCTGFPPPSPHFGFGQNLLPERHLSGRQILAAVVLPRSHSTWFPRRCKLSRLTNECL